MVASISADAIVSVVPSVLSAGGTALQMNGLILTSNTRVPIGTVPLFASAPNVATYFGATSQEAAMAVNYFLGYNNSSVKPGALLFAQYPVAPVSGYLRGGNLSSMSLATLQALSGSLVVVIDGVTKTASSLSFSGAASFSAAAALIQTGLSGGSVTYDSVSGAFVIASTTTGAASSVGFATGTLASSLLLTSATGAVLSPGAIAGVPATNMAAILAITTNWASFTTTWEPTASTKVQFAAWTNSTLDNYAYMMWDSDITVTQANPTASAGYLIQQAGYSGTVPIYAPTNLSTMGAFAIGYPASLNWSQLNARATMAFKSQTGIAADVVNQTIAAQLLLNGYSFYGTYATANQLFTWFYNGAISGPFLWADSYVDQIYLDNACQLALMSLLQSNGSIPYNPAGYALIKAALQVPCQNMLNFGGIRVGVALSSVQQAEVTAQAGVNITNALLNFGYFIQVLDPGAQIRAARGSPIVNVWYVDGQSVQLITLDTIEVQ